MKIGALVLAAALLASSASANEPAGPVVVAPAEPNAREFSFASHFAQGLRIAIGAANEAGDRTLTLENCGVQSHATQRFSFNRPGYVLLVYEDGDTAQHATSCDLSIRVLLTNDNSFDDRIEALPVDIRARGSRFSVLN